MINPYADVNWGTINKVAMTTHDHCKTQYALDRLIGEGVGAIALSNYYKSEPAYPLSGTAASVSDPSDPIIDLSGISGMIEIPNAEHHNCTNITSSFHFNSVGSRWSSGKPYGETPVGVNGTWQSAIQSIRESLLFADGGGTTINHPVWSGLGLRDIYALLDYDETVLGIEIYNQTCELMNEKGWATDVWDEVLKTGRRCWGFAVPDHDCEKNSRSDREGDPWLGKIVVLCSNVAQHDLLTAIRNGVFYAQIGHSSLSFGGISIDGKNATVTTNKSATIKAIANGKTVAQTTGTSLSATLPSNAVYARFEASADGDTIYSNPIMYRKPAKSTATNLLLIG